MHGSQSSGHRLPEGATTLMETVMRDNQHSGSNSNTWMIVGVWSDGWHGSYPIVMASGYN